MVRGMSGWVCAALAGAAFWGSSANRVVGQTKPVPAKTTSTKPAANKAVATVNGESITWSQLEPILKHAGPTPPETSDQTRREMHREAVGMLIDDLLVKQFLKKHVPAVPKAEVDKKMSELAEGLKANKKSMTDLCKESGQTEAEIRENIAEVLQWQAYADKQVTEADVKKYYEYNKDFFDRVQVRASHIVIKLTAKSTEAEKTAAAAKLKELRAQLVAGKLDFAAAAKLHSHCPSASNGGDIGAFPRKFVVDEQFARVAFALKPNQISDVVSTEFGLHLIKVTERQAGQPTDYAKIKGDVREVYLEEMRQNILAQLRKNAKIELHLP